MNPNSFISHNVNFLQQYSTKIKKTKIVTSLSSIFSLSQNKSSEFNSNNISIQNGLKESFIFKNGMGFQPGFGVILSNYGNYFNSSSRMHTSYWVESGNSFNLKKSITIQYSARYNIDRVLGNSLNASSIINIKVFKTLMINAKCQVSLLPNTASIAGNQNINAGVGISYSW